MWMNVARNIRVASVGISVLALAGMAAAHPVAAATRGISVDLRQEDKQGSPVVETVRLYQNSFALVVGIDDYTNGWPRLANAVKDAERVAEALERQGFDVTRAIDVDSIGLETRLKEFFVIKGADPEARLFVWYAGHGHTENGEGFLVGADAPLPDSGVGFKLKALPMRRFGEYVRLAQSKHVFAVFDSCFGGTIFDTQRARVPAAITRATTLPVRQFLTSGDANQLVSDNGMFRELFLRALAGDENADANGDGYVTATELGLHLASRVTNLTEGRQTPRYGKLRDRDYDRGDFVFVNLRGIPAVPETPVGETVGLARADSQAMEIEYWRSVRASTDAADFQSYLDAYPDGQFTALAHNRLNLLAPGSVAAPGARTIVLDKASEAAPNTNAAPVEPSMPVQAPSTPPATAEISGTPWLQDQETDAAIPTKPEKSTAAEIDVAVATPAQTPIVVAPIMATPAGGFDGHWTGRLIADPSGLVSPFCVNVYRKPMQLDLEIANQKIRGVAQGVSSWAIYMPLKAQHDDKGDFTLNGRNRVSGTWFSMQATINLATGDGTWRDINNGCRGHVEISRAP